MIFRLKHIQKYKSYIIYIDNPVLIDEYTILYEAFDILNYRKVIFYFDIEKCTVEEIVKDTDTELPFLLPDGRIMQISKSDENSLLYFQAFIEWIRSNRYIPFSVSNNYLGRLSWNESYRILQLGLFYEYSKHSVFKTLIYESVNNVLRRYQKDKWLTRKYSIDKESDLDIPESQNTLFYALLMQCGKGILDSDTEKQIL